MAVLTAAPDDHASLTLVDLSDGDSRPETRLERVEALSQAAIELARAASEAEVANAVATAAATLAPGSPIRLYSAGPGGWHLVLDEQTQDEAVLRLPLRAGGTLLGELAVLGAAPLPASQASGVAELAAHTALALARLEYGHLISGVTPEHDPDMFAATSFRDPLTNLPSRMLLHDRVEHALHRRSRQVHPVAVLIIDLAGSISAVREGMGPAIGDRLMVQVAKRLQRLVRSADTLARVRDDQICALLDDLDSPRDASLVAERLMSGLQEAFILDGEIPVTLQAHIGIAVNGGAAESAVELLHKATRSAQKARARGLGFEADPARPELAAAARPSRR